MRTSFPAGRRTADALRAKEKFQRRFKRLDAVWRLLTRMRKSVGTAGALSLPQPGYIDAITGRYGSKTTWFFLQEIVMRNFLFSTTLVAVAFLQIAIVASVLLGA
ncbi:MAG: hypothetical protein ABI885_30940 [Gammaproteobacteria bacterium]